MPQRPRRLGPSQVRFTVPSRKGPLDLPATPAAPFRALSPPLPLSHRPLVLSLLGPIGQGTQTGQLAVATRAQARSGPTALLGDWGAPRTLAISILPAPILTGAFAAPEMGDYTVRLEQATTRVRPRQPGRTMPFYVWVGWGGDDTTHRHGAQTRTVTGRWHFTLICRDIRSTPSDVVIQTLTDMGNQMLPGLGELRIAGPPYDVPRHAGQEFPSLYCVHVASMAHTRLSTLMNQMERLLRLDHLHRDNFHLSIDEAPPPEEPEEEWEWWEIVD